MNGMLNRWFSRNKYWAANYQLYLMLALPVAYFVIFKYIPMYGAQIAFKDFHPHEGIWGSEWTGLDHFRKFFNSHMFSRVVVNTLLLSFYQLIFAFPFPVIFALALNNMKVQWYKKSLQMITYAPHFISVVVMAGIIIQLLDLRTGMVNQILVALGFEAVNFMGEPGFFRSIYVWSHIWQNTGWGTIIYLAALSTIEPQLHEAAVIDGASRIQRVRHIDIPQIMPQIVILLILQTGRIMQVGFQKVLLLQNPLNMRTAEVIQTYVYKVGLASAISNFSYAAAIGLFMAVINLALIITVNWIARRMGRTSLW